MPQRLPVRVQTDVRHASCAARMLAGVLGAETAAFNISAKVFLAGIKHKQKQYDKYRSNKSTATISKAFGMLRWRCSGIYPIRISIPWRLSLSLLHHQCTVQS